nr:MAG TPA: hypothetical protein [Caudoviricetes sp.]
MNQEELAKYRVLAEQNRKLRRLCEALKAENELLRKAQNERSRAFDEENREMFLIIHGNHRREEVFIFR